MSYLFLNNNYGQRGGVQRDSNGPIEKQGSTSVEGGGGSQAPAPSQGPSNTASPGEFTQSKNLQGAATAVLQRNKGQETGVQGAIVQPREQQAQATQAKLQNEANQYMQNNTAQADKDMSGFNYDSTKDVAGNYGKFNSILNYQAKPIDQFTTQTSTKLTPSSFAKTGNVAADLASTRGGNYTSGMAGLDATLFGRNKGERSAALTKLGQLQGGLNSQLKGYQDNLQGEATAKRQAIIDNSQRVLKDYLGQRQNEINSGVAGKTSALQQQLQAKDTASQAQAQQMFEQQKQKALGELQHTMQSAQESGDKDLQRDIQNRMNDLSRSQFSDSMKRTGTGPVTAEQLRSAAITGDDANQYNAISSLLGLGSNLQAGNGFDANAYDPSFGYDTAMFNNDALSNRAAEAYQAAHTPQKSNGNTDPLYYEAFNPSAQKAAGYVMNPINSAAQGDILGAGAGMAQPMVDMNDAALKVGKSLGSSLGWI